VTGDRQATEDRSIAEESVIPEEEGEEEQTVMQDDQVTAVLKNEDGDSGDVTAMSDVTQG
jgi:hypothetical protein